MVVPSGPIDVYQSIQRVEPGAWVAAHTHEGPESGVVLSASLARFEPGGTREFHAGARFFTPAGTVHATGNPGTDPAEAITLHVVRAGSPFSTPCACAGAPVAVPGSSNPARSLIRELVALRPCIIASHARLRLVAPEPLVLAPEAVAIVTVLAGSIRSADAVLDVAGYRVLRSSVTLEPGPAGATVLLSLLAFVPEDERDS